MQIPIAGPEVVVFLHGGHALGGGGGWGIVPRILRCNTQANVTANVSLHGRRMRGNLCHLPQPNQQCRSPSRRRPRGIQEF